MLLASIYILSGCNSNNHSAANDILSTFSIADGFQLELVAMEPLVSDPVAMEIDENGAVYVVEMHGYPLDISGSGIIKRLYDDNEDGVFDRSEIFCDQLTLPTGIMKWKSGVLVTDPPDLLYLEDTDGDGKADKREVVLTGFALSNPQHNFNNPVFGLDNWIYLANEGTYKSTGFEDLFGDSGEEIRFPNQPDANSLPKNANDLNLKADLINHRLEILSGESQFGHTFSQWGDHFGTKNWAHIYHEVLDAKYLDRNQNLEISSAMQYVPDYGIGFEIFPITRNPEHQLLTDVGAITSSCGITWYQGGLFPEPYSNVMFIAEPTHNLIHTDIMYNKGATFYSQQQFNDREFLASTDSWFRPVNFYIGPDGAMYILDYYRKIIEHPEWISEEVQNSGDLYEGLDKGRIYRVAPAGAGNGNNVSVGLASATPKELIQYLGHPNIWWRRNAQRLIVSGQDADLIAEVEEFAQTAQALGLVHALWTLEGLKYFDRELIMNSLEHPEPGVRINAIKIAELHRNSLQELETTLIDMVSDPDSKVRYQLLCTLGYYQSPRAKQARQDLILNDIADPWVQLAGLSASTVDVLALFKQSVLRLGNSPSPAAESWFTNLCRSVGKREQASELNEILNILTVSSNEGGNWWRVAAIKGLAQTVKTDLAKSLGTGAYQTLTGYFIEATDHQLRSGSLELLNSLGYFKQQLPIVNKAKRVALDPGLSAEYRADALKVLAWWDADANTQLFQQLLVTSENSVLRMGVIEALVQTTGIEESRFLIDQWSQLAPDERDIAVNVFGVNNQRRMLFLRAIEQGAIQASVLGWGRTVRLLNSRDDEVRELARKVLEGNETISDSVWQQYQNVLTLNGDPIAGAEVFKRSCAICHQVGGADGTNFGPDLSAVGNRGKSGIMIDILKPNRSISDGYDLWTIEDNSGKLVTGIVTGENSNTLTLRIATGEEVLIPQNEIIKKTAAEISGMPEGLHNQISQQQMADLLEYLKGN